MNLLQILNFLLSNTETSQLVLQLFSKLFDQNFNLAEFLGSINFEKISSLLSTFFQPSNEGAKEQNSTFSLNPISSIANQDIVKSLNRYFENNP